MTSFLVAVIILLIVSASIRALWKARKKGVQCMGCPSGGSCSGKCSCHSK